MTPTPIILDCDPGHDDAIALLLAVASPEVELIGVTTVAGNTTIDKTTNNALRILELAGRADIPVYRGADRPFIRPQDVANHVHGESGLDGPDLPQPKTREQDLHAVDYLAQEIRARDGKVSAILGLKLDTSNPGGYGMSDPAQTGIVFGIGIQNAATDLIEYLLSSTEASPQRINGEAGKRRRRARKTP